MNHNNSAFNLKKIGTTALKISLTAIALWWVFQKIDRAALQDILWRANWWYLIVALVLFNASKIMSSFRLNHFFRCIGLVLPESANLRLYYIGMFYNLFLPGGIGGDGYKIYLLHQRYSIAVKSLLAATLLDRISGVVALAVLAVGLSLGSHLYIATQTLPYSAFFPWIAAIGSLALVVFFYIYVHFQMPVYRKVLHITNFQALAVQSLQVAAALCILWALQVQHNYMDYLLLFLLSSIAAILPLTIGGVGMRELVMLLGYAYLPIESEQAVAFSLLFFVITAASSLVGAFLEGI